jgi:hypothetical protein
MVGIIIAPLCFWLFVGWLLADWKPVEGKPPAPKTPIFNAAAIVVVGAVLVVWAGSFIV